MLLLALVLAALIGLSLGFLGGGGSIVTVPVLVYVPGFAAKPAIAMSLPVVGVTSLAGAALHWRMGNVRLRTALSFGLFAMAGAFAGARLSVFLSGAVQLALLGIIMLVAATAMLHGTRAGRPSDEVASNTSPGGAVLSIVALGVGVLTGLVGIGGGFLVVPALVLLAHVPMREAVGTSLLVIAMNAGSGFVGYLGTVDIEWRFLAVFTAISAAGALGGTLLVHRVPQATLKRVFAVFLLVMGGFVLYSNRDAFRATAATDAPIDSTSVAAVVAKSGPAR